MRRSMIEMLRCRPQRNYHGNATNFPSLMKRWITMNVVTLVTPNLEISQQMIEELQKWTQQQPSRVFDDTATAAASITTTTTPSIHYESTTKHITPSFHYIHEHNDALDDFVQSKTNQSGNNLIIDYFQQYFKQRLSSITPPNVDSMVLFIGGNSSALNPMTLIHFISLTTTKRNSLSLLSNDGKRGSACIDLLAIQSMQFPLDTTAVSNQHEMIHEVRKRLAHLLVDEDKNFTVKQKSSPSLSWIDNMKMSIQKFIRQQQRTSTKTNRSVFSSLLRNNEYIPFLDFGAPPPSNHSVDENYERKVGDLKEIVIPFDYNDSYLQKSNNPTVLEQLSDMHRPVTGLYRLPYSSNICIRPIPMAKEDRAMSLSPTLIFHSDSRQIDHVQQQDRSTNRDEKVSSTTKFMKIGYTGIGTTSGQLMIGSGTWNGIQVRLCSKSQPTSMFAEAQDSLLASSLHELQSQEVLLESRKKTDSMAEVDPRLNNADCWVELRANLRNPLGFMSSSQTASFSLLSMTNRTSNPPKIAKAPNLPYE